MGPFDDFMHCHSGIFCLFIFLEFVCLKISPRAILKSKKVSIPPMCSLFRLPVEAVRKRAHSGRNARDRH